MGVDPEQRQAGMPPHLSGQRRDRGAVVAAEHRQERLRGDLHEALHRHHPAGLDVAAGIQVADVLDAQTGQEVAFFGDRRHRR